MPSASASTDSCEPMLPYPTMPEPPAAHLVAAGRRLVPDARRASARFLSVSRRVSAMISAITSSTTLRVLENGALNTAIPRRDAAARSIWLVPMQNAPTAQQAAARRRAPGR